MRCISWRHLVWAWVALIAWDVFWGLTLSGWWARCIMGALLIAAVTGLIRAVREDERERNRPRTLIVLPGLTIDTPLRPTEARRFIQGFQEEEQP